MHAFDYFLSGKFFLSKKTLTISFALVAWQSLQAQLGPCLKSIDQHYEYETFRVSIYSKIFDDKTRRTIDALKSFINQNCGSSSFFIEAINGDTNVCWLGRGNKLKEAEWHTRQLKAYMSYLSKSKLDEIRSALDKLYVSLI